MDMEEFKINATDKMAHLEESVKSAHKRIDELHLLTKSVYELASSVKTMQRDVANVSDRLTAIEEKPAKRWDLIVTTAITAIVGITIGYFFGV